MAKFSLWLSFSYQSLSKGHQWPAKSLSSSAWQKRLFTCWLVLLAEIFWPFSHFTVSRYTRQHTWSRTSKIHTLCLEQGIWSEKGSHESDSTIMKSSFFAQCYITCSEHTLWIL
jgi:hypothetical protein